MKILVTGADGQVGSRLVRQVLAKNYEVKALVLPKHATCIASIG